jgi:uncharacterized membrane protein
MSGLVLDFHGGGENLPVWMLLIGISLVLCSWGAVQIFRRRWANGAMLILPGILVVLALFYPGAKIPVLVIQLVAGVVGIYFSTYSVLGAKKWTLLLVLRLAAILVLLLILLKPAIVLSPGDDDARKMLAIAVDRSASMGTDDEPSLPDRYTQSVRMLRSQRGRIEKIFRTSWFDFATSAQKLDSSDKLATLSPSGPGSDTTNIATALNTINTSKPDKLAGVILISDGINNGPDPISAANQLNVPVYTLGVGSQSARKTGSTNLQLLGVDAPMEAAANNVTEISVRLQATNLTDQPCNVQLFEGFPTMSTTPAAEVVVTPDANSKTLTAKLKWTPRISPGAGQSGIRKLRIVTSAGARETNLSDNEAALYVLVTNPRLGVLYIEGTIRPEYKYLRRLLQSDPNVQFLALVRISENKFWAQGSINGQILDGLPKTDKEFGLFNVIILGDIDRSFFSDSQLLSMKKFVSDGGGLIMLGGRNSFGAGGYAGTPLADVLPVEIAPRHKNDEQNSIPFVPQLTAEGQNHPIFAGIGGFFPGPEGLRPDSTLAKLPSLSGCVRVLRAKRSANMLAIDPKTSNVNGPLVVLAVQRFGAGRSVAFTADTTWKWYLPMRAMREQSPYFRFWGQMVRWAAGVEQKTKAGGGNAILRVSTNHIQIGEKPLDISVKVNFDPNAKSSTKVEKIYCDVSADGSETTETISLDATPSRGLYKGSWTPKTPGEYTVKLTGASVEIDPNFNALPVNVSAGSAELANLTRNDKLLRKIAFATRGRFADIAAFPDLLDQIITEQTRAKGSGLDSASQTATTKATRTRRLYNFPILFILFVIFLTTEWLLRRKWQHVA